MGLRHFFSGELIEIIEWTDDTRDTVVWRFPDDDKAIKHGAQLIVRESQMAQFVYLGQFGDTFPPGRHTLTTDNIPVLTKLRSWVYGFESPFKADLYFVSTRLFTGNKWGTANPVMLRDEDFGVVRLRAFGTYEFRVVDPRTLLRNVSGSDQDFRLAEFVDTMRSRLVGLFSSSVAAAKIPVLDVAARCGEIGGAVLPLINAVAVPQYGIEITSFVVENVSVPAEVERAIDARASTAAIGDLSEYVKYQVGQGLAAGGGGAAGTAAELAVGFGMAQQMLHGGGWPELLSPADVAQALGVTEADVMTVLESGELKGRKIGATWRVPRAALNSYLAQ